MYEKMQARMRAMEALAANQPDVAGLQDPPTSVEAPRLESPLLLKILSIRVVPRSRARSALEPPLL